MKSRRRHRGVALITAMLITAIVASLATGLSADNALDVRRTTMLLFHDQSVQVALGAESWMRNILRDDAIDSPTDHLGELWASELPGLPVDNGSVQGAVTGSVQDLQGRFNVNNLIDANGEVDEVYFEQFKRLLMALELDQRFAGLTVDWLDADQNASFPDGAEDPIYTGMSPPYRTYNRPLSNVSELAALEGMTQGAFLHLQPHITALPARTAINVNTATGPVLRSLGQGEFGLDEATVENLLEMRESGGFPDFKQVFDPLIDRRLENAISETSSFFELKAIVQIDTVRLTYFSLIARVPQGGPVTVLARSQGTL